MMAAGGARLPVPGLMLGRYPERRAGEADRPPRLRGLGVAASLVPDRWSLGRYRRFAARVARAAAGLREMTGDAWSARLRTARATLSRRGFADDPLVEGFALAAEAARRSLGRQPFETQLIAARVMFDNRLAEMATGEGKTLAAALCAAVAALAGVPVQVLTANDYLVERDALALAPLFGLLGLSVGHVTAVDDTAARARAHACDVTYCTARELAFDYLRDRVARRGRTAPPLLRGLCMAVIDEADSVLIDEARMPLVLSESRPHAGEAAFHAAALGMARALLRDVDFRLEASGRQAHLTASGDARVVELAARLPPLWRNRRHREEVVRTALAALHGYRRDVDYIVHEGRLTLVDETTGRVAPGRAWSRGLHQLVEIKEGLAPTGMAVTAAQITYQRFFRRFLRVGGMSGTLAEARLELARVYGLPVVRVPLRLPGLRRDLPARLYGDPAAHALAVTRRALALARTGRPVLIGTDSVRDSERLARCFSIAGAKVALLNARQDAMEAAIVAQAGEPGRITVATNMAGRGTDIALAAEAAASGGLHVICCQRNGSRRIDRQLVGRAARRGDPGSAETLLPVGALDLPRPLVRVLATLAGARGLVRPAWLVQLLVRWPQWRHERRARADRALMLERDLRAERSLAAVGVTE